jgi:hypothetical protein
VYAGNAIYRVDYPARYALCILQDAVDSSRDYQKSLLSAPPNLVVSGRKGRFVRAVNERPSCPYLSGFDRHPTSVLVVRYELRARYRVCIQHNALYRFSRSYLIHWMGCELKSDNGQRCHDKYPKNDSTGEFWFSTGGDVVTEF